MNGNISARVWMEIDLDALEENFNKIRTAVAPAKVLTVLKANAYGLGVEKIAERLDRAGTAGFCVAELREALDLLHFGKPVQILGSVLDFELPSAVEHNLILGITDLECAKRISAEAVRQGKTVECHFKLDTGMGRLGILAEKAPGLIPEVMKLPNLNCCGIYSHFPSAEHGEDDFNTRQMQKFHTVLDAMKAKNIHFTKIHMANSDAVNNCPHAVSKPFNHVRAGIDLYGGFSEAGQKNLGLRPVLTLKTKVGAVRELPAGYTVGYSGTCRLMKPTRVATICAGYADGLPLQLSNRGYVAIKDRLCPILGRISMDYTVVSLEQFEPGEITPGCEAVFIGGKGTAAIPVENWAQLKGTHPYDILCSIGPRVKRIYRSKENGGLHS